ncbi:MAG TPA: hypothetical protein VJN64_16420 [Terriglobales bacterium]|nr:hypothetical protein [Terriglobales bacterium]
MARLIAFDQKTAAALRQQMPQHQIFEHGAADVVDFAIGGPETLVAVLPVDTPGEAGVAVFRRQRIERQAPAQPPQETTVSAQSEASVERMEPNHRQAREDSVHSVSVEEPRDTAPLRIRAGGFLGLRDEAVFEEEGEKPAQKGGWWRRFWDED